jgi:predicted aspartyl protease
MGITHISASVTGPTGKRVTIRFLVDSGATYTLLPEKDWKRIGLKPKRSELFGLADGTTIERKVSEALIVIGNVDGHTPIILGENGDQPLLGVVTLGALGLEFWTSDSKLHPARLFLAEMFPFSTSTSTSTCRFGLVLNPFSRKLQPMRLLLARAKARTKKVEVKVKMTGNEGPGD